MAGGELGEGFTDTLAGLPVGAFSTADFINEYRSRWPEEWAVVEAQFGVGGKGAGQYHTAFTRVAKQLSKLARSGELTKLDYRPSPDWWGNSIVQFWTKIGAETPEGTTAPLDHEYREGTIKLKIHLQRERSRGLAKKKKAAFLEKHGTLFCERCKVDPVGAYGDHGVAVIEVHHASTRVGAMKAGHVTKLDDLQCLCANCHRLVHAELQS